MTDSFFLRFTKIALASVLVGCGGTANDAALEGASGGTETPANTPGQSSNPSAPSGPSTPTPTPTPPKPTPNIVPSKPSVCSAVGANAKTLTTLPSAEGAVGVFASDDTYVYFLRRLQAAGPFRVLSRVAIAGGPVETVATAPDGSGFLEHLAKSSGRVAYGIGTIAGTSFEDVHLFVTDGPTSTPVPSPWAEPIAIRRFAMTPNGAVVFGLRGSTSQGSNPASLPVFHWPGTTGAASTSIGSFLPSTSWVTTNDRILLATQESGAIRFDTIYLGALSGGPLPMGEAFTNSGNTILGADENALYFGDGSTMHSVLVTGTDIATVSAAMPYEHAFVDSNPGILVFRNGELRARPKIDETELTTIMTSTETVTALTADACNVYVAVDGPPRILARSRK